MTSSTWSTLILRPKDYLLLGTILVAIIIIPFLGIISYPVYVAALLVTHFLPSYGRFISYFDAWMEEDFVTKIPRNTVVTTMVLDGDITLEELRNLFRKNVLQAKSSRNPDKIRYPELQQYLTTLMGFRIWKNDRRFRIGNHILEQSGIENNNNNNYNLETDFLDSIHQKLLNRPYPKYQSPWEITLIRNVSPEHLVHPPNDNNNDNTEHLPRTVIACRVHHVLADGKSMLKLLVECLGQKQLKTAVPKMYPESLPTKIVHYLLLPFNFIRHFIHLSYILPRSHLHPWKVRKYWKDSETKTNVAFSPKLPLVDIKQVAKQQGVTGSAVVMSVVAGGIRRCEGNLGVGEVAMGYPLPKPDHPEFLTNHVYMGFMNIPTNDSNVVTRLKQCNKVFIKTKTSQQGRIIDLSTFLVGTQLFPVTRLAVNQFTPTGITNIAGEEEGFSIGKAECIDFRMSVGTLVGVAGVVFCAFSYKDGIRIAIIAKENILEREQAKKLALDIGQEFQILKAS